MKTMMKITRKSYEIAIALAIALAGLMARDAGAALYNGYYTGDYGRDDNARVYISTFEEETYGVVMQINRKGTRVSLFNIEEQEDGTTQWTPMFQSNAHVITSGEAMYIGRYERSSVLKRRMLILNPTRSAYDAGIKEEVSVRRRSLKGYSRVWKQLPAQGFRIERTKNANGFVTPAAFSGKFKLDGAVYSGNFGMREIVPGVYLVRAAVPNTEAAGGRKLDKSAIAVVIPILRKRAGLRDYFHLHMVSVKSGVLSSTYSSATLEQD
ncbi:MAG: hypothetical protein A2583_04205 [Bdellovibrionales bacterium RIFOXYD1_FULL_53_11]|nr:MAG: hypothetical protein A2583_04205 [Bdellovibrionales bacterium RIFOXYD1_FULL_53_11]